MLQNGIQFRKNPQQIQIVSAKRMKEREKEKRTKIRGSKAEYCENCPFFSFRVARSGPRPTRQINAANTRFYQNHSIFQRQHSPYEFGTLDVM